MSKYQGKPLPSMTGGELDRRCDRVAADLACMGQVGTVAAVAAAIGGPLAAPVAMAATYVLCRRRSEQGYSPMLDTPAK